MKYPVIWLMGLAGSGKSIIARALYQKIKLRHNNVLYFDGDEIRAVMGDTKGYKRADRVDTTLRRIDLIKLLNDQEMIIIASTIGLFSEIYEYLDEKIGKNLEKIYVKCDFDELLRRDQKGLYSGALKGEIKDVVGVDIEYDEPQNAFVLDNSKTNNLDEKVDMILKKLNLN